jgi:hypothetical protein
MKKTPKTMAAKTAMPPTTPPAMAPTGVDFLFSTGRGEEIGEGGRTVDESEDSGSVGLEGEGVGRDDRPVVVESAWKCTVSRHFVEKIGRFTYCPHLSPSISIHPSPSYHRTSNWSMEPGH